MKARRGVETPLCSLNWGVIPMLNNLSSATASKVIILLKQNVIMFWKISELDPFWMIGLGVEKIKKYRGLLQNLRVFIFAIVKLTYEGLLSSIKETVYGTLLSISYMFCQIFVLDFTTESISNLNNWKIWKNTKLCKGTSNTAKETLCWKNQRSKISWHCPFKLTSTIE